MTNPYNISIRISRENWFNVAIDNLTRSNFISRPAKVQFTWDWRSPAFSGFRSSAIWSNRQHRTVSYKDAKSNLQITCYTRDEALHDTLRQFRAKAASRAARFPLPGQSVLLFNPRTRGVRCVQCAGTRATPFFFWNENMQTFSCLILKYQNITVKHSAFSFVK